MSCGPSRQMPTEECRELKTLFTSNYCVFNPSFIFLTFCILSNWPPIIPLYIYCVIFLFQAQQKCFEPLLFCKNKGHTFITGDCQWKQKLISAVMPTFSFYVHYLTLPPFHFFFLLAQLTKQNHSGWPRHPPPQSLPPWSINLLPPAWHSFSSSFSNLSSSILYPLSLLLMLPSNPLPWDHYSAVLPWQQR